MTYTFKLARRLAVSRNFVVLTALALLAACMGDSTAPDTDTAATPTAITALQISPRTVTVETNQPVRFRGHTRNWHGDLITIPIAWGASGGTINADGTFSSVTSGTFKVTGRGKGWKQTDTSVVVVVPPSPGLVRIGIAPDSAKLDAGAARAFTATGYLSDNSTTTVGVTWSATGGEIDPAGLYSAGLTAGTFRVIAVNTTGTVADTAVVVVNPPPAPTPTPTLASVVVSPVTVSVVSGGTKQFKAYGRNSVGDSVPVTVAFSATGGAVSSSGLYTAGQSAGSYKVIATANGLADTAAVSVTTPVPVPAPSTTGKVGVPFGPFGAWSDLTLKANTDDFTMSLDAVTASNIVARISAARSRGVQLLLTMTGGSRSQYLTNGVFDRSKWSARQQSFNTSQIRQAVASGLADGTIVGNVVMDEPFNVGGPGNEANSWGPSGTLTKAIVDDMCREAKSIFPDLPQGVTHDHKDFEPTKSYYVCDFIVSQYRMAKGDVAAFRDAGLALAARDHHKIAFSLNIIDGGPRDNVNDGVWNCPIPQTGGKGSYAPNCRMTPTQVREYGKILGQAGCALTMWRYDATFMANPENVQAFRDVAATLANAPARSCRRS
jgi:hypothetical protein